MDREKKEKVRRPGRRLAVIFLAIALSIAMMPLAAFAGISYEGDAVNAAEASADNDTRDGSEGGSAPKSELSGGGDTGEVIGNGKAGEAGGANEENGSDADLKAAEGSRDGLTEAAEVRSADGQTGDGEGDRDWADSLYVLGIRVDSSNCDDVLSDGGSVKYDRDSRTLTLTKATLDIGDFDGSAFAETNKAYGISTWQDTNIVLAGSSRIISSGTSFAEGTEYVYGIEAIGGINISGSGSLSIEIDTADTSASGIEKYLGIESSGKLNVSGSTLNVSMEGGGESCGINTNWKGFALSDGAEVRSESTGGSNRAVYDSSYKKSTVEYGSSFEMISDYAAFQFSRLSDSVADGTILANSEPTSEGAEDWNKTTDLTTYKYVKLLGSGGRSRASSEVYILGRPLESGKTYDDDDTFPHSGKISYDSASRTLTLENATIDLDDFNIDTVANIAVGIYATSDIRIVLKGSNTIKATNNNYPSGTEYVSGIESWGTVSISDGSAGASLSIGLAKTGSGNSKINIAGISSDDSVFVDAAEVIIEMGQYGKCTGIYAWRPLYLTDAADVTVSASGSGNIAVNGPNQIGASEIKGGSTLTMNSDGVAFNCWTPKDALKQIDCTVSKNKDGDPGEEWDRKSYLYNYKYVQFSSSGRSFGKDIRVLGRKITDKNCDDVLEDGGSVIYDMDSKTLTLNNANLDFAKFDHEYDHDENPDSGTNMIVGIDAEDDITIVLNGRNRIFTTKDSFDEKKEYVYGIDSGMMNDMTIEGDGTLEIAFDKVNEKLSYTGIDVGDSFKVDGVSVTVDLGGELEGTGVDCMMGAIKLINGGTLRVNADGGSSTGVFYRMAYELSIGAGSMLEMASEGKAFENYMLSDEVKELGALVNDKPTAEDASEWDGQTYLANYKYVRFPKSYKHTHELKHFEGKAASCTEPGNIEYWVCWKCGTYFSDEGTTAISPDDIFTPKLDHQWSNWTPVDETKHQRRCAYDTAGTHIQTEDHAWDGGKVTKKATLFKKGVRTYKCSVCSAKRTEEFSLADAIKDAAGKVVDKIREWIEKIINGGDDPDVLPTELTVTLSQDTFTYNGKMQKPEIVSVMAGSEEIEDYTAEFDENSKDAGSYTVNVTFGIEEYSLSGSASYTIVPAEITDVTVNRTSFTYNGGVQKPSIVSVKAGSLKLGASDYTYEYSDSRSSDVGDYSLTVEGNGNFCGSKTVPYVIRKAANPLSVSGKTATVRYKKLKKRAQTVSAGSVMSVNNAEGSVSYTLNSVSKAKYRKYFSVNSANGNVTIKKKLRKGTYTLNVSVSAAGNDKYDAATRTVAFKIKVK